MEHYDVVIIGAGLAGLHCARLLGRRGLGVLLVDRKESLDASIHTTGIFVRRTLEDFDIPDDCLGPAVRHVTLYSPSRRQLEIVSPHDEFRVGKMGRLYKRYLDHCLRAAVTWLPGTRYAEHARVNDRLKVRLDSNGGSRACGGISGAWNRTRAWACGRCTSARRRPAVAGRSSRRPTPARTAAPAATLSTPWQLVASCC